MGSIRRTSTYLVTYMLLISAVVAVTAGSATADHTADPASVAIAGSLQSELGCPGDWQPECANTELAFDADDTVWQATFNVPAGSWEYKAPLNDLWTENYGAGGVADGPNIGLTLGAATDVKFYYDHATHWITDNENSTIATVAGSFQSELGCPGDWQPDCLRSWMQDPDGDGVYEYATDQIPAGSYEFKVALDETWDTSFPASNVPFTNGTGDIVAFTYDTNGNAVTVDVTPVGTQSVTIAGSLQSELGCPGDWQPDCAATHLTFDAEDDVWQGTFSVPAGSYEYKAALNDSWDENYGANAVPGGANIPLAAPGGDVKFYFDDKSNWVTDNVNSAIATVAGSFQSELGCSGDWQPWCLRSWMQDIDGDGIYTFATDAIPQGSYEFKVARDEDWAVSYPASNVPFTAPGGTTITFTYDSTSNDVAVDVGAGTSEPGDELLVTAPVRKEVQDRVFYFVMPDRFDNGDPTNDTGGSVSPDPLVHGTLPTHKGYYHGGDLAGLTARLPYLDSLGVSAVWLTPQFRNDWVQGDGTIGGSSAGYHGYWQIDYSQIDPHFGTNAEMQSFVTAAHSLGIDVFFDIVANHTGDVITYTEGTQPSYIAKADQPYLDASGVPFDDRDFAGTGTFPPLDAAVSFPYTPTFADPADTTVKFPDFLDDPIYYHNRGNSTFSGENSLYGDFFGLDDLFTEHPVVQDGLIQVFKDMVTDYDVDGFRVDTVKHVNDEFWEAFGPELEAHAASLGKDDFFFFGEVFDFAVPFLSRFSTDLPLHSTLDFAFQGTARSFASQSGPTDNVRGLYEADDYYTDADSNAYQLPLFLGNHDIGRFGLFVNQDNPGAADTELLARDVLGHALMFFGRGMPVVYYGDEQGFVGDGGDQDARQDMMPSVVPSYVDDDNIGTAATPADSNFDDTHILYQTLSDFSQLLEAHPALTRGAQLHRYSEPTAGIYAFSRIERTEKVEYVVALNNSEAADSATFATDSPGISFTELWPGTGPALTADSFGNLTVAVPALDFKLYRADAPMTLATVAPVVTMDAPAAGAEVTGRLEVVASLSLSNAAEVTFTVSVDGAPYEVIGTDDNAPYRVFYDVSALAAGTAVEFKAIADNMSGSISSAKVAAVVGAEDTGGGPFGGFDYAVIHYNRPAADYGDHTTGDFNDFWGLHLWGDAIDPAELTDWPQPKPFLGEDEFGRFAWVRRGGSDSQVNFIVHQGDTKDTPDDRFFDADVNPEIWINQGDATIYTSQAAAQGYVTIRYHRDDGDYGTPSPDFNTFWGLHLWGDAIDPAEGTDWTSPKPPDGIDDFGAFWTVDVVDVTQPVNFIIHRGDQKDPGPDESFVPQDVPTVWKMSGDTEIYPSRGAAEDFATIHYHRADGDYGDPSSPDFNDFWGMHVWDGAASPNPAWQDPVRPDSFDIFGPEFVVDLVDGAPLLAYILHRGDTKDPGPDQFLVFDEWGYEVWQLEGEHPSNREQPHYVLPIVGPAAQPGDIAQQRAHWVAEDTIVWAAGGDPAAKYELCHAATGGMTLGDPGVDGGTCIELALGAPFPAGVEGFFHLAGLPTLTVPAPADVPVILTGQLAVVATKDGGRLDATGLQIPGVLDDLYATDVPLGALFAGDPTLRLWAPTAKNVTLHVFDDADPATLSTTVPMTFDPASGTWAAAGDSSWVGKYYLYEVEVYVHSTGQVEHNMVTDPYSVSLSMNSQRSQIVDLSDASLAPAGFASVAKPPLGSFEDIAIYELHVRDFSANDATVPDGLQGTFKAFTVDDSDGMSHLGDLAESGLTHVHLLPVFDIATINEDKSSWQSPDPAVLETYPPDSDQQQAAVEATADLDGFNWGYDPFHYTTPEGSYSTDPDGTTRIVEFREMVQSLNETGLRVVMDVVYNHTNAAGQADKSVLDRVVPGYYHRLDDQGAVTTSTCCPNTATEHTMVQRLMVDSVVTWAKQYKVDGFRFDLMGHHTKANMLEVRAALDALTLADDGVDGSKIYLYGEGWNFGEVADDARFVQATQLNMAGTGIGTFSDRLRDAVRGGGPFDGGTSRITNQGFINGLVYDPNAAALPPAQAEAESLLSADQIRVGLAGNLSAYEFEAADGVVRRGDEIDYNGSPAGYTEDPQENIVYVSAHDNETLFDVSQYKHDLSVSAADRARAQSVGIALTALAQGVNFFHAGVDTLRSKSMDRDSFNSGDWFNRLDWTYQDNNWAVGLPVASKNQAEWPIMQPFLADPSIEPAPGDIAATVATTQEFLRIRSSSPLFSLPTAADVQERVAFHNTGPNQVHGLIVMSISDRVGDDLDEDFEEVVVVFNATNDWQSFAVPGTVDQEWELHRIQRMSSDPIVQSSWHTPATGTFNVPPRTAAVFVTDITPPVITASLTKDRGGKKAGWFEVGFSCTDASGVTATAADIRGIPVVDGEMVKLTIVPGQEVPRSRRDGRGRLHIWADYFEMTVTCEDGAGNMATEVIPAVF